MDKLVVGVVVKFAGLNRILRILVPECARDQSGVGPRGFAHPYPDPTVLLQDRERSDGDAFRYPLAAWDFHTVTRSREFEAVVHAAYVVAFEPAARQWCKPVAAAVLQCRDRPLRSAIEDDGFANDGPRGDLALGHLVTPASHVPKISQKHRTIPRGFYARPLGQVYTELTPVGTLTAPSAKMDQAPVGTGRRACSAELWCSSRWLCSLRQIRPPNWTFRYREEFRMPIGVRKSPKNEPATQRRELWGFAIQDQTAIAGMAVR